MPTLNRFLSTKCLRDSLDTVHLILITDHHDPVSDVVFPDRQLNWTRDDEGMPEGFRKTMITFVSDPGTSIRFQVSFKSGTLLEKTIRVPKVDQSLAAPLSEMVETFNYTPDKYTNTYSFIDAIFYSEEVGVAKSYIFPSSDQEYLDTSGSEDFFHNSGKSFAYVLSNDLQNHFLNEIGYEVGDEKNTTLGRFKGGRRDQILRVVTAAATQMPVEESNGPTVYGELHYLEMMELNPETKEVHVCKNPQESNYYLTGCIDEAFPCHKVTGGSFQKDCNNTALSQNTINNSLVLDGGCCIGSCPGYHLRAEEVTGATLGTADGVGRITILNGAKTFNIQATVKALWLDDPRESFSTTVVSLGAITDNFFSLTSLNAGLYHVSVYDSTSGCTNFTYLRITRDGSDQDFATSGIGCTDNTALNYDSAATLGADELCVFCDFDSGKLKAGGSSTFEVDWVELSGPVKVTAPTSTPAGGNSSDGTVTVPALTFRTHAVANASGNIQTFNSLDHFDGTSQANPYYYELRKLLISSDEFRSQLAEKRKNKENVGAWVRGAAVTQQTSFLTAPDTGEQVFRSVRPADYIIWVSYNNDGNPTDGNVEDEQCYLLSDVFTVARSGCTDPNAINYNSQAQVNDGSCNYPKAFSKSLNCTGALDFSISYRCREGEGIQVEVKNILGSNPDLVLIAQQNSFPFTLGPFAGQTFDGSNYGDAQQNLLQTAAMYIWAEILCSGTHPSSTNIPPPQYGIPTATDTENGILLSAGANPYDSLKFLKVVFTAVFPNNVRLPMLPVGGNLVSMYNLITNNVTPSGLIPNQPIIDNGAPIAIEMSYHYGEYDLWDREYTGLQYPGEADLATVVSCIGIPSLIRACTDPLAVNYTPPGPGITTENSLCVYDDPVGTDIPGCTDRNASNYNPEATIDDGSCVYDRQGWLCVSPGDCQPTLNNPQAYTSFEGCIGKCIGSDTDCDKIKDADMDESTTTVSNAPSVFDPNSSSGLPCDPTGNGAIKINFPDHTPLNDAIDNAIGAYFTITVFRQSEEFPGQVEYYTNYLPGRQFFTPPASPVPPGPGDLLSASVYSNSSYTFEVPHGAWKVRIAYHADAYSPAPGAEIQIDPESKCNREDILSVFVGIQDCDVIIQGCTDPAAENYNPSATVDNGSCVYSGNGCNGECLCSDGTWSVNCCPPDPACGCTDPAALNFNPLADQDNGSCIYGTSTIAGCVPTGVESLLSYNISCIDASGNKFYNKLIGGLENTCESRDAWRMIMIHKIMQNKGLPCLYNCTDDGTPELDTIIVDCEARWAAAGSLTWTPALGAQLSLGAVVRRGDDIFIAISNIGLDKDPVHALNSSSLDTGWRLCISTPAQDGSEPYLQKFVSFARKFCRDCGIDQLTQVEPQDANVDQLLNIGGVVITSGGVNFVIDPGDQ